LNGSYSVLLDEDDADVDLRKRTRTEQWTKRARRKAQGYDDEAHEHVFSEGVQVEGEEVVRRKCEVCGMETEEIVL